MRLYGKKVLSISEPMRRSVGTAECHSSYVTADGYRLGSWVNTQRIQEDHMSPERKARLDALGFVWDAHGAKWEEGYQHLKAYVSEHGHCRVP